MVYYHISCRLPDVITPDGHIGILENGSLVIHNVLSTDAGNYTCRAINEYGSSDSITVRLLVLGECEYIPLACACP